MRPDNSRPLSKRSEPASRLILSPPFSTTIGRVLKEQGDATGAANALALAARLDPEIAAKLGR